MGKINEAVQGFLEQVDISVFLPKDLKPPSFYSNISHKKKTFWERFRGDVLRVLVSLVMCTGIALAVLYGKPGPFGSVFHPVRYH